MRSSAQGSSRRSCTRTGTPASAAPDPGHPDSLFCGSSGSPRGDRVLLPPCARETFWLQTWSCRFTPDSGAGPGNPQGRWPRARMGGWVGSSRSPVRSSLHAWVSLTSSAFALALSRPPAGPPRVPGTSFCLWPLRARAKSPIEAFVGNRHARPTKPGSQETPPFVSSVSLGKRAHVFGWRKGLTRPPLCHCPPPGGGRGASEDELGSPRRAHRQALQSEW